MPHLTVQMTPLGPVLDFLIGVSQTRAQVLTSAKLPVPSMVAARGLIDTGASITCIDPTILQALNLTPIGIIPIITPSTGSAAYLCNQFDVSLMLTRPPLNYLRPNMPVIESTLSHQGIDALIGRDVLSECLFVYDGSADQYMLSF